MNNRILLLMFCLSPFAALQARADWFQLVRADTGAYIANAEVEVHGRRSTVTYTDFFGRFQVTLPSGEYDAIVLKNRWRKQFQIQVDGRNVIKVHRLQ